MNSNRKSGTPLNNLDFDLGFGSDRPRTLNDQKSKSNPSLYSSTTPSWQPGKPSWTHQPAPSQIGVTRTELGGPTSMVGDISGKSWNAGVPSGTGTRGAGGADIGIGIGIVNKNPNLFGDLVSSALGQNKSSGNVPLKSAPPVKGAFSMGGMGDLLPKTSYSSGSNAWGSSPSSSGLIGNVGYGSNSMNKSSGLGGAPLGGSVSRGGGIGVGMSANKDPFGSLVGLGSKPMGGIGLSSAPKTKPNSADFAFGDFQNASKPNASAFSSGRSNPVGSNSASVPKMDSFVPEKQTPAQPGVEFWGGNATSNTQQLSGEDEWGFHSQFDGGHDEGTTTELDGLPPPPSGVSASVAKTKGLDNYKQGQYADAIKWLCWAEILLEKAGDTAGAMEILTCRASCYKEAGEYKKAVADCTKALHHDGKNVGVLVQRALLYESMEKYRLGADDLRTVMKLDPGNRVARSTIHRLNKMAD